MSNCLRSLLLAGLLLAGCRPDQSDLPPPLKPLLETLPARYRSLPDRQDTLTSYWAPDSLLLDSLFNFTSAHRSQVLLRVQRVPASVAAAARLDTLRFRRPAFRFEEYERPGYHWDFFNSQLAPTVPETTDGVPLRMALTYSSRLALVEYQRWPGGNSYQRNDYLMDYPFGAVAEAQVSDSVVYIRAYPLLADRPRPDTLYTYYHDGPRRKRIPLVVDQPDTTRQVLLRLSFRVLQHSAD
ncbi:MAG: hypothetical protein ACRYFX_21735 [Janthinobacterium lividum]